MHAFSKYSSAQQDPMPHMHRTMLALVRSEGTDLTMRQLAVFLSVYLDDGPHTVRDLASRLDIHKPAICRALDRLGELDLARRRIDPLDRRGVFVLPTPTGWGFLAGLRDAADASAASDPSRRAAAALSTSAAERAERRWAVAAAREGAGPPRRGGVAAAADGRRAPAAGNVTSLRRPSDGDAGPQPRPDAPLRAPLDRAAHT